ncbi:hypothetical protein E2C01_038201 [Portunus trituberculatus]|uniref:Uncharacterized protein n=1 Tax=Portunus trituberculatus TaxID=210409 RepID=A0A5B7FG79_PORTR|nr:hypothetical protein [Portunus trituberculatus]
MVESVSFSRMLSSVLQNSYTITRIFKTPLENLITFHQTSPPLPPPSIT